MGDKTESSPPPKSLADVLAEELDGKLGDEHTQELPIDEKQDRLKEIFARIHSEKPRRSALCLSGGGIRSATFGLGILQGLARCGLLNKFDYLSTVSGGGYIGSWLSAWIKNHPHGIAGVIAELQSRPNCALNPDPEPIRHLRKFSNYLAPKTGLMSVDFWTLITTFIRNMFLNWLVLISLLGAAMMIPRFYLVAVTLEPDWLELSNQHAQYLKDHPDLQADWIQWADSIKHHWDIGLTILPVIAFVLVAIAMAYAIIDVPSTGNARLPQSRFLRFRQLPLFLASLILAAWWAVYRNVHGSEPFQPTEWLLKFVVFSIATYLAGGVLAWVSLSFRKSEQKSRPARLLDTVLRLSTIVLTAALAGLCLWAMATRSFLFPSGTEFVLNRACEPIQIANQAKPFWNQAPPYPSFKLPTGSRYLKGGSATCPESDSQNTPLADNEFVLAKDSNPIEFQQVADYLQTPAMLQAYPPGEKPTIPACTHVLFAWEDLTALQPVLVPAPAQFALNYVCFAPALILGVLMLVNFLFTGLTSKVSEDEDREWWGRSAAWILITICGWIVVNVIVLWGAQAITATTTGNDLQVFLGQVQTNPIAKFVVGAFGGVSGIAGALLGLRSKMGKKADQKRSFQWLLVVVAVVFFLLLSVVISWTLLLISSRSGVETTLWFLPWDMGTTWHGERLFVITFLTGVTLLFGIVMGFFINANTFSLHAIYRNRLIRAYLAASRSEGDRRPNLFTGFDPNDNFKLHELKTDKPLHVINGALNLVKGEELAWQDRKAESFTMSRLHCGSWHVGYRPSTEYANDGKGVTLGTALAISGAAANPNMGYHSSSVVSFLMTLFNVRLGWWLGNPGPAGAKTWHRAGPHYSVGPLFSEALGNTTDSYQYVNLSDGGHFENLGLYEMVLRRCHYIVVSDAGEDPECSFADLGEAIRKIRIDFGIPIEFESMNIFPRSQIDTLRKDGQKGYHCAIGRIGYSAVDLDENDEQATDGTIIYLKPACYGDEPRDIYEYFRKSATFPHESTADQFFSESQFESYRMLGLYTVQNLCKKSVKDFPDFVAEIKEQLRPGAPSSSGSDTNASLA